LALTEGALIARWLVLAVRGFSAGSSVFSLRGLLGLGILAVVSFLLVMSYAGLGAILQSGRERRERPQMEDRYRSMIEETSDIIQIVSPDGKFLYVNRAWHNTFGYGDDELANLTLTDLLHPDEREKARPQIGVLMNEGGVIEIETRFVTKTGSTIWVEGNSTCEVARAEVFSGRDIFRSVTQPRYSPGAAFFTTSPSANMGRRSVPGCWPSWKKRPISLARPRRTEKSCGSTGPSGACSTWKKSPT